MQSHTYLLLHYHSSEKLVSQSFSNMNSRPSTLSREKKLGTILSGLKNRYRISHFCRPEHIKLVVILHLTFDIHEHPGLGKALLDLSVPRHSMLICSGHFCRMLLQYLIPTAVVQMILIHSACIAWSWSRRGLHSRTQSPVRSPL